MDSKLINLKALESLARRISEKYATKDEINSKISSIYSFGGSKGSLDPSLLTKDNVGKVYNMTSELTTNPTDYVEGLEQTYPMGTNVAVVDVGSESYKFDVLSGFVDLSPYAKTENIQSIVDSSLENNIASSEEVDSTLSSVFET